jgi:hypothetical protein
MEWELVKEQLVDESLPTEECFGAMEQGIVSEDSLSPEDESSSETKLVDEELPTKGELAAKLSSVKDRKKRKLSDKKAFRDYTGVGYYSINNALRTGDVTPAVQDRIDVLLRALSNPDPDLAEVFNGTVFRSARLPLSLKSTSLPGATFTDWAFFGCSREKSKAIFVNRGIEEERNKFEVLFVIKCKTA